MIDTTSRLLSIAVIFGGPTIVATGIATWLSSLISSRVLERQRARYASELETLKGEVERTVYYTKTGFDTEFNALMAIWKTLVDLRSTMTRAIAAMDVDPSNFGLISFQDLENAETNLNDTRTNYVQATEQNSPFYFEELHLILTEITSAANEVLKRISKVAHEQRTELRRSPADGKAEFDAFNEKVVKVSSLIRKRLTQLGMVK
jgi:hypothetical protein